VLSNRRAIMNGAYALYIYVNMVQVIGVFCTSAAECPVGLLVEIWRFYDFQNGEPQQISSVQQE